jgi:transposase
VKTVIGQDTSEHLDMAPAQYRVIVTHRPKLACRACEGTIVQRLSPPKLIEGGIPTEPLVARYADHQSLYRRAQMMARLQRPNTAAHLAETAPELIARRQAARGLDHELIEVLVGCLTATGGHEDSTAPPP